MYLFPFPSFFGAFAALMVSIISCICIVNTSPSVYLLYSFYQFPVFPSDTMPLPGYLLLILTISFYDVSFLMLLPYSSGFPELPTPYIPFLLVGQIFLFPFCHKVTVLLCYWQDIYITSLLYYFGCLFHPDFQHLSAYIWMYLSISSIFSSSNSCLMSVCAFLSVIFLSIS